MLLPIETWSAAWACPSACTSCSIVSPCSASRCSSQLFAKAKCGLCPCRCRVSSARNAPDSGGFARAMSASTRIRSVGFCSTTLHHALGPVVGQVAIAAPGGHPRRHAAQVLDQRQPQHDRHRPQLAELQWRDASGRKR